MARKKVSQNPYNQFTRFIKSFDFFGSKMDFEYLDEGTEYKTLSGGCASILIKLAVYFIFVNRIFQLLT